jgi:hypothetical protein
MSIEYNFIDFIKITSIIYRDNNNKIANYYEYAL